MTGPTFDELLAQLKVCPVCRALLLEKTADEHKMWHAEQLSLIKAALDVPEPRPRWRFPLEFGPRPR